jgi:hypothetical protein
MPNDTFLYVGGFGSERTRNYDVSPREGFAFHFRFKPEDAKDDRFLPSRWTSINSSLDVLIYTTITKLVSPTILSLDRFPIKPARLPSFHNATTKEERLGGPG